MSQESRRRAWEKKQQRLEAERRRKKEIVRAAQSSAVSLSMDTNPVMSGVAAKNDVVSADQNSSAKPKRSLLERWQSLVAGITAIWKPISAAVVAMGGILGVYAFLTPDLAISPGVIPNETNAVSAEFNVKNSGHVTVYKSILSCSLFSNGRSVTFEGNKIRDLARQKSQYISRLAPGDTATRPCGPDLFVSVPFPSTIQVTVSSRWGWPWPVLWRTSPSYFTSLRDATGHIQIVPDNP